MTRLLSLVILATVFHVLMVWATLSLDAKADPIIGSAPLWYELAQAPLNSLTGVLPGLALGYIAKRNGLLLGALCGLLAGPIELGLVISHWGSLTFTPQTIALLASGAFGTAVVSAAAGGAGQLIATGSNNSFKPSPFATSAMSRH